MIGESSKIKGRSPKCDNFIPTNYPGLVDDMVAGKKILFDDGRIVALAQERDGDLFKIKINLIAKKYD